MKHCQQSKKHSGTPALAKTNFKNLPKIFVDTNVWFSAFYESINADKILKAHVDKKILAVISRRVLDELVRNISRKIPRAIEPLQVFLEATPPVIVKDPQALLPTIKLLAHKKDQLILQAAVNSQAKYLISGNLKHFSIAKIRAKFNLHVLSPTQVVKLFKL